MELPNCIVCGLPQYTQHQNCCVTCKKCERITTPVFVTQNHGAAGGMKSFFVCEYCGWKIHRGDI